MNTILKRVVSLLLCFVLMAGYLPAGAFATESGDAVATEPTVVATEPSQVSVETTAAPTATTGTPTEPSTEAATELPSETPSEVPTAAPTAAPTETPTEAPTEAPTEPAVIAVTGITLDVTTLEVGVGAEPVTLTATVMPEDATDKTVTWTSSESGVASVVDGVVTFGYMGEAVITATAGEFSATCTVTVGEGEWDTYEGGTVVIAGSDYQKQSTEPKTTTANILAQIEADYPVVSGFIFGGDYTQSLDSTSATKTGKDELQGVVQGVYGTNMDEIYVQGNHDPDASTTNGTLTTSGAHDSDAYGVYVINEKDYPWGYYHKSDMQAKTQATATALEAYLNAKVDAGYSKPIFVVSHLPLHYTTRTSSQGDGMYAKYLYDVLDAAGDAGLNIIFLFGHNHSSGYDAYLGNGSIYLAEGDTIHIANEGSGSTYFGDTLSFTYMNYGYVGYVGGSSCTHLTMTAFEITDSQVTVKRYDTSGLHNLKEAGSTTSGCPAADTSVVGTEGAVIKLGAPDPVVEDNNVAVQAPGLTDLKVEKIKNPTYDSAVYEAYASYDITPAGYADGTEAKVTITLDDEDNFDADRSVEVIDVKLGTTQIVNIVDGKVTFTTNHFSTYNVGQRAIVTTDWITISDGTGKSTYELDTNGVDSGAEYLIVDDEDPWALNVNGVPVEITINGTQATTTAGNGWTITGSSPYQIHRGTSILQNDLSTSNNQFSWYISGTNTYTIRTGRSSGNYIRWSASNSVFQVSSRSGSFRLFKHLSTDTGAAEYAMLEGKLNYQVDPNTSEADALTAVKAGITVYTSGSADGSNASTVDAANLEFTWTSGYEGETTAGTYYVDISYKGVKLATAKVVVPAFTIVSADVTPASATVANGAPQNTETGSVLNVDVGGNADDISNHPVTIGMLRHPDGSRVTTSHAGTFTDLQVVYNDVIVFEGFTLTVAPKAGNQYPNYPDPGAVQVNKTATGIDFQASGVATVELSASGIPMNEGVDVVLVLDTSSSMDANGDTFTFEDENGNTVSGKRIALLRPVVNNLIQQFKTPREDGSEPDIDIAIVTFNGNTIMEDTNYIGSGGSRGTNYGIKTDNGKNTGTLSDAWVAIKDISSTWATDNNNANTPTASGTNYDYGLQKAYDLLKWKQDNNTSERKQFVLFLSDGAPSQYNGVESNDGNAEYENWILGNYKTTDEMPSTIETNKSFYTGYNNNNGQLHRTAEAIKALPGDPATMVTYDEEGVAEVKEVNGLGATMYAIGMLLKANGERSADDQAKVLRTIATDENRFRPVENIIELKGIFNQFANEVLLAASNARFVDEMGEMYDLQLNPVEYLPTGKTDESEKATISPVIEVRSYDIYTRAEYDAGDFTDIDMIGDRKGTYETLELVEIDSATEATSSALTDTNIIKDGVICAKYFYYNTTSAPVTVDGITVGAETFYWKLGDIKTTELAIRYNVYLTQALGENGGREAGSYDTNKSAVLYYNNYLGTPCKKETVSPTLAWKGALVNYAFYLVDASSGKPVNNDGKEVPFSERTVIINPTFHKSVNFNTDGTADPMSIVAGQDNILPTGYWLYDEAAAYIVEVHGNGTGEWRISGNSNSTYVTGYDGDKYTNENSDSEEHPDHDYTHTTVWFAVKWEPRAVPDTVVIDYGLPVDVHVMTNDFFGKYGTLEGVKSGADAIADTITKATAGITDKTATGTYGSAVVSVPTSDANESNSVIRYTLNSMQMNAPEVFTYSVKYENDNLELSKGSYYGTLTVIPATTIYYEDEFVNTWTETKENGSWSKDEESGWTFAYNDGQESGVTGATQGEDRPGDINFAFDTVIDANNIYGYDSAYANMSQYSLGSAAKVNVKSGHRAKATFEFYGTGFDVISVTSNTTGTIMVNVYAQSGDGFVTTPTKSYTVDTYYGYTKDAEGNWVVNEGATDALYQVPVMKIKGLTYGKYKAEIVAAYDSLFDHNQYDNKSYDFYLDAIRIYDPAGKTSDQIDDTIENAYSKDGELFPEYNELRNWILAANNFNASGENVTVKGAVFIDGVAENKNVADYKSYGPNNEVYLMKGQSVAFKRNAAKAGYNPNVHIALKSVGGNAKAKISYLNGSALVTAFELDVNTATDLYYDITALNGKTILIESTGDAVLSITNVKYAYQQISGSSSSGSSSDPAVVEETVEAAPFTITKADVEAILACLNYVEEEIPETTVPEIEPSEPETEPTVPETEPAKPDSTELKAAVEEAKKLKEKDYTKESFKALKDALKDAEKVLKDKKVTQAKIDNALAALDEAVEALETKAPAAKPEKPGKDEKPGKNEKPGKDEKPGKAENQNKPAGNQGNAQKEQNLVTMILDALLGWLFG